MPDFYWDDSNIVTDEVIHAVDGGYVSEIEYLNKYGERIGYWAYGSFDPSLPYQGDDEC